MKKYNVISAMVLVTTLLISMNAFGNDFKEPRKPDAQKVFDTEKEKKIDDISGLTEEEAFEQLKADEFLTNPDLSYKAIDKTFHHRKAHILALAQGYLMLPMKEVVNGKTVIWAKDFLVAKRILETFPEEAVQVLVSLYNDGDAVTKGNSILAAGQVGGGHQIRQLLIQALDDKSSYEEADEDDLGEPLRICDVAYNQLVHRYSIRKVHRTIGPANTIEVRDQLIDMLKGMMQ